jgi:hypothetical protein
MSKESTAEFRSPKRALARSFRLSRDRWKEKAGQRRAEIRALKVRLRDLEVSRDLWKQKATHLQSQLDLLRASPEADSSPPAAPDLAQASLALAPGAQAPLVTTGVVLTPLAQAASIAQAPSAPPGPSSLRIPPADEAPGKKKRRSKGRPASA